MKIFVTGATGFIGSALCARLMADGHEVTGMVRTQSNQSHSKPIHSTVLIDDLSLILPEHLRGHDAVVHTAGLAHQEDQSRPFHQVNVLGTETLAHACVDADVSQLIHISTTKAVGGGSVGPNSVINPEGLYGQSKRDAEILLESLREKTDLKISILRIPLVFGPGVKGHFPKLVKLARTPLPLPYSALKARRSYLYLENLLDFIAHCLRGRMEDSDWINNNFYVADKEMISLGEVLSSLSKAQGKLTLNLPLPASLVRTCAKTILSKSRYQQLFLDCKTDIGETTSTTGWQPGCTTKEGIDKMFLPN